MSAQEFLDHYKNKIIKYEDNPDVLTRSLQKLDQVRVTIDLLAVGCIGIVALLLLDCVINLICILQSTGVGKTVSALKKKYGDSQIGDLSRDLVAKWKAAVAREEEERENDEEEAAENGNDDHDPSPEYSAPVYVPTLISTEESRKRGSEEEREQHGDSSQDEEQHARKSKKKKSHREHRSEERESHRSEKQQKHKREKEREKEKKHKHSDRDKEKEKESSRSKEKEKEHKRKSSHRDKHREDFVKTKEIKKEKKCDMKEGSDQSDNNHRTDSAGHSGHSGRQDIQKELRRTSKSEHKHARSKHPDLSSFDMFSKPGLEIKTEKSSSRKRHSEILEESSCSKQPKLLETSQKYSLPSLPSSFSGNNLIPDISPIYKPLPRSNPFLAEKQVTEAEGKNDIDLSILLSSKNKGMSRIYRCKYLKLNQNL